MRKKRKMKMNRNKIVKMRKMGFWYTGMKLPLTFFLKKVSFLVILVFGFCFVKVDLRFCSVCVIRITGRKERRIFVYVDKMWPSFQQDCKEYLGGFCFRHLTDFQACERHVPCFFSLIVYLFGCHYHEQKILMYNF